jgi:tetratricopeptide (TPR) repeat protein
MKRLLPLLIFLFACIAGVLLLRKPSAPAISLQTAPAKDAPPLEVATGELLARLSVETQPAGASLLLNGRLAGSTPILVSALTPGPYAVRLERDGCQPLSFRVDLGSDGATLVRKLEPLPTGALVVDVQPRGAEVLLDGELLGYSPLKLDRLTAGTYDLLIRRTNYKTYAARTEIVPGKTQTYAGFDLGDRVLEMLEGTQHAEPQRVSHYIDLGHYYFVNDNLEKSVDAYARGMEADRLPLNFDGPGYPGREHMTDAERAFEVQMKRKDGERLLKEIDKHRRWPGKDRDFGREFSRKIDQAMEQANVANPSWEWASRAADISLGNGNLDKAERIYSDFINAEARASQPAKDNGNAADAPKAYAALMELYISKKDMLKLAETFEAFYKANASNAAALRVCGAALLKHPLEGIANKPDRMRVLELAERALSRGVEITYDKDVKSQAQAELGMALLKMSRFEEAVKQFQAALDATEDETVREDRTLSLASALRGAGRLDDARAICEKLSGSANAKIRRRAEAELQTIQNALRKK